MLRSLVGSEMCIRDRCRGRSSETLPPGIPTLDGEILVLGLRLDERLVGHCLLYTSDAADDLLCVDLGGRRIIKKKKKVRKHAQQHKDT